MNAAILSIGDELTLGQCVDTNASWLSSEFAASGIMTTEHRTVADDREAIARAIRELASGVRVLVITGGLGPTQDDLTRFGLADALDPGSELVVDPGAVAQLATWFDKRSQPMPQSNHVQTRRPPSTRMIPNPHGTAPGLTGEFDQCRIFALPGPPREMMPMFQNHVRPVLADLGKGITIFTEMINSFGIGESLAAERLGELLARDRETMVGITAGGSIVTARVRFRGAGDQARDEVQRVASRIEDLWKPYAYGRGEETLSQVMGMLLRDQGKTFATAESCTGGWLGKLIVDVPGSSDYYRGGWVTYTNEMKSACLGLSKDLFDEGGPGAVSEIAACAMAEGAIKQSGAAYSLAITGIAGPNGGTTDKPVGTVYIGLGRMGGEQIKTVVRRFAFSGDRLAVRHRSALTALQMLRFELLSVAEKVPMLWETPMTETSGS